MILPFFFRVCIIASRHQFIHSPIITRFRSTQLSITQPPPMTAQFEIFEQRIEKLEESVGEILTLVKGLSSYKDVNNEELNKEDETTKKGSNEEEEISKVVIVTPSQDERVKEEEIKMLSKIEMLEKKR